MNTNSLIDFDWLNCAWRTPGRLWCVRTTWIRDWIFTPIRPSNLSMLMIITDYSNICHNFGRFNFNSSRSNAISIDVNHQYSNHSELLLSFCVWCDLIRIINRKSVALRISQKMFLFFIFISTICGRENHLCVLNIQPRANINWLKIQIHFSNWFSRLKSWSCTHKSNFVKHRICSNSDFPHNRSCSQPASRLSARISDYVYFYFQTCGMPTTCTVIDAIIIISFMVWFITIQMFVCAEHHWIAEQRFVFLSLPLARFVVAVVSILSMNAEIIICM